MRRLLLLSGVLLAGALAVFLLWFSQSATWVRDRVVMALNERFASQVELGSLRLSLVPLRLALQRVGRHRATGGLYNLHRELIDFRGDLLLNARLADMTSSVKSLLARIAQPLFRGPNGGTRLPIRITGTRSQPSFRLDVRRVFRR
jgi:hypothetical protein